MPGPLHEGGRFRDRMDAGQRLATALLKFRSENPMVLGLARGGVPVAAEVARSLEAPLDVLVARKLGCPWQPELGIGAIGEGGARAVNEGLVASLNLRPTELEEVVRQEEGILDARVRKYRGDGPPISLEGRTAILIDDGLATGYTARVGIEVLRRRGARRVVLAVPVAPKGTIEELEEVADEVVVLATPSFFFAIGQWYEDFGQVSDQEVIDLLNPREQGG